MSNQLTTEEKIDIIYEKLIAREKKEKITVMVRWGFRVFMILYILYFFFFALPGIMDNFKDSITPDFSGTQISTDAMQKISDFLNR